MPPDLIVLTASNGDNLKLAECFVLAAANQKASAELIVSRSSTCPCSRRGSRPQDWVLTWWSCTTNCTNHRTV